MRRKPTLVALSSLDGGLVLVQFWKQECGSFHTSCSLKSSLSWSVIFNPILSGYKNKKNYFHNVTFEHIFFKIQTKSYLYLELTINIIIQCNNTRQLPHIYISCRSCAAGYKCTYRNRPCLPSPPPHACFALLSKGQIFLPHLSSLTWTMRPCPPSSSEALVKIKKDFISVSPVWIHLPLRTKRNHIEKMLAH